MNRVFAMPQISRNDVNDIYEILESIVSETNSQKIKREKYQICYMLTK